METMEIAGLPVLWLGAAWLGTMWLGMVNFAAWFAFREDKRAAERGEWRIPEASLLTLAALGGSIGALLASRRFRHKTRKQPFRALLLLIATLQAAALLAAAIYGLGAMLLSASAG